MNFIAELSGFFLAVLAAFVNGLTPRFGDTPVFHGFEYGRDKVGHRHGIFARARFADIAGTRPRVAVSGVRNFVVARFHGIERHGFVVVERNVGIGLAVLAVSVAVFVDIDVFNGVAVRVENFYFDFDIVVITVGRSRFGERDRTVDRNVFLNARNGKGRVARVVYAGLNFNIENLAEMLGAGRAELCRISDKKLTVGAVELHRSVRGGGVCRLALAFFNIIRRGVSGSGCDNGVVAFVFLKNIVVVIIHHAREREHDISVVFDIRGNIRAVIVYFKEKFLVERYAHVKIVRKSVLSIGNFIITHLQSRHFVIYNSDFLVVGRGNSNGRACNCGNVEHIAVIASVFDINAFKHFALADACARSRSFGKRRRNGRNREHKESKHHRQTKQYNRRGKSEFSD